MITEIETAIAVVEELQASIANLEVKIVSLQSELQSAQDKEASILSNANLSREEKTAAVLHTRALKDVIVSDIASAKAEKESTENAAFEAGKESHRLIRLFWDTKREAAIAKAIVLLESILDLQVGEAQHFAGRVKTVANLERVEYLSFSSNHKSAGLNQLPKLRVIFNQLQSIPE